MADEEHIKILEQGVEAWNKWREENPDIRPNLIDAVLFEANLNEANLYKANLIGANLRGANLIGADLSEARLLEAYLIGANLSEANLIGADLSGADLSGADLSGADLSEADLSGANLSVADLSGANLSGARLSGALLEKANLSGANLSEADLVLANLIEANLSGANLIEANLSVASLITTNLTNADLTGCSIFGISAWKVNVEGAKQSDLKISDFNEPVITVDNLEVAQFVYLLLHNEKLRDLIDTIISKGVLILGRFTPERKAILDAIREKLRELNYVPMMFDFERPTDRDFTETIKILAGMCRFVIVDITKPRASPVELQATVPDYMIPFVPIIQEGETPYEMFKDLVNKYDWILTPLEYPNKEKLLEHLEKEVIEPALEKHRELAIRKAAELTTRSL